MTRVKLFFSIVGLCAIAASSWAATFYVDAAGGVDTNDGLSPATAWMTNGQIIYVNASSWSRANKQ